MLQANRWIRNFFGLSRSQANGFIILLPLLTIFVLSEPVYRWYKTGRDHNLAKDQAQLDSLVHLWQNSAKNSEKPVSMNQKHHLFAFDPNTATVDELQTIGFSKGLSTRIAHYRQKGGKFRTKQDLLKIYHMDSAFYHRVYAYIQLPETLKNETWHKKVEFAETERKEIATFDLNKADTLQLKMIYGIGEKLSMRIIRFREGLGGFVSMDQLKEVYGLDSTVVNRLAKRAFIEEGFQPKKIRLNKADRDVLANHPYLTRQAADAIVAYRFQHGDFNAIDELAQIHALDTNTLRKLAPYLILQD